MRLALELLTVKPDPALVQRIEHDIGEMNQLIGQLLEIAKGLKLEPAQDLALCAWLKARTQVHQAAAAAAGARLSVDCAGELHATAPPGVLTRIIDNLLVNALRDAPGPVDLVGQALPAKRPASPPACALAC